MSMRGLKGEHTIDGTRRKLLLRLGLAASALYVAPALLQLGRARASSFSASFRPQRQRRAARPQPSPSAPPEIVVTTPSGADIDLIATQGYALIVRGRLEVADAELARFALPADLTVEQARQQIADLAPAALVDINHVYRPEEFACGGDTCAAFEAIGWRGSAHACPSGVVIGMIDTQVNTEHAALEAVNVEAFPALAGDRQPASSVHGTAVAILMAGRHDSRTPGLLQGARIVAAESFHRDGAGADTADAYDVVRGIDMLVRRGIGVINLSFTGPDNAILKKVVDVAIDRDVILVAAAGNAGPSADPLYPAAYDGVVAVTWTREGRTCVMRWPLTIVVMRTIALNALRVTPRAGSPVSFANASAVRGGCSS
jgi:hypothetical protein